MNNNSNNNNNNEDHDHDHNEGEEQVPSFLTRQAIPSLEEEVVAVAASHQVGMLPVVVVPRPPTSAGVGALLPWYNNAHAPRQNIQSAAAAAAAVDPLFLDPPPHHHHQHRPMLRFWGPPPPSLPLPPPSLTLRAPASTIAPPAAAAAAAFRPAPSLFVFHQERMNANVTSDNNNNNNSNNHFYDVTSRRSTLVESRHCSLVAETNSSSSSGSKIRRCNSLPLLLSSTEDCSVQNRLSYDDYDYRQQQQQQQQRRRRSLDSCLFMKEYNSHCQQQQQQQGGADAGDAVTVTASPASATATARHMDLPNTMVQIPNAAVAANNNHDNDNNNDDIVTNHIHPEINEQYQQQYQQLQQELAYLMGQLTQLRDRGRDEAVEEEVILLQHNNNNRQYHDQHQHQHYHQQQQHHQQQQQQQYSRRNNAQSLLMREIHRQRIMTTALRPVVSNQRRCKILNIETKFDHEARLLAAALQQNFILESLHVYPAQWKDLIVMKQVAMAIQSHPTLTHVQLHQWPLGYENDSTEELYHYFNTIATTNSNNNSNVTGIHANPLPPPPLQPPRRYLQQQQKQQRRQQQQHFLTEIALNRLLAAMATNPSITHWTLYFSTFVTPELCTVISSCTHLESLELIGTALLMNDANNNYGNNDDDDDNSNSRSKSCHLGMAIASAQPSLKSLKLTNVASGTVVDDIFRCCADKIRKEDRNRTGAAQSSSSCLESIYINGMVTPCTKELGEFLALRGCRVQTLALKGGSANFHRPHMVNLVKGLIENRSVKSLSFLSCQFHPEVVRCLQELIRTRLDLEFFEITSCTADPTMAVLTCFQNNNSHVKSLAMRYSIGLEERLGGDAIRYVLKQNKTLEVLNLTGSSRLGERGMRPLAKGLGQNCVLKHLDLSHCHIDRGSLQLLLNGIKSNSESSLVSLNLSHNALGVAGTRMLVDEWILSPGCKVQTLLLNRCDIIAEAFLMLLQAVTENTSLEHLELQDCGRLTLQELQTTAEVMFGIRHLTVLKVSCGGSIRPRQTPAIDGPVGTANADIMNIAANGIEVPPIVDEGDETDDDDDEEAGRAACPGFSGQWNDSPTGALKLLKDTWSAALINNKSLTLISFAGILEGVLKPKDTASIYSWMDFCGRRNQLEPRLLGAEFKLFDILLESVDTCWDYRNSELTPTGLSLDYYTLRSRPDGVSILQNLLELSG